MKNKQVLANKNPVSLHKTIYVSGLAALLLAGCGQTTSWEQLTGIRPEQRIDGPRRSPLLNQRTAPIYGAEFKDNAMGQAPQLDYQPTIKPAASPYDMYDDKGNEISKSPQKAPAAPSTANNRTPKDLHAQGTYLKESKETKSLSKEPDRKPLAGNPYAPAGSMLEETPKPAKILEATPETKPVDLYSGKPAAQESSIIEKTAEQPTPISEIKSGSLPEPQTTKGDGDFFDRIGSYFSTETKDTKTGGEQSEYPKISSVPPKPEEFDAVKREQQQNLDELKFERTAAQQEKGDLEQELSGGTPIKPLLPSTEKPQEKTLGKVKIPTSSVTPIVVDDKKTELKEPDFAKTAPALSLPAPNEENKTTTTDFIVPVSPPQENVAAEPQAPSKPLLEVSAPKALEASSEPKEEAPTVAPATAYKAEDNISGDGSYSVSDSYLQSSFVPASEFLKKMDNATPPAQDSSLPSPSIIKTMPPSRYEGLRKQPNSAN